MDSLANRKLPDVTQHAAQQAAQLGRHGHGPRMLTQLLLTQQRRAHQPRAVRIDVADLDSKVCI